MLQSFHYESFNTENTKYQYTEYQEIFSAIMSKALSLLYLLWEKCWTGCHDLQIDPHLSGKISKHLM